MGPGDDAPTPAVTIEPEPEPHEAAALLQAVGALLQADVALASRGPAGSRWWTAALHEALDGRGP